MSEFGGQFIGGHIVVHLAVSAWSTPRKLLGRHVSFWLSLKQAVLIP